MKKIYITSYLIFVFFMISCITETENHRIQYKFQIINNSKKDIRILAYNKNNLNIKETQIFNSEIIEKSFISSARGKAYLFSDLLDGDSIKVIYNNKFNIFYCFLGSGGNGCNTPRNILNEVNDFDTSENIFLRKYVFLEIDYENAEDCNGDCD